MIEHYGDVWSYSCDAICVTTNGFVKNNGEAVMGRGIAQQAAQRYPELPRLLGRAIRRYGNLPALLIPYPPAIISFPVKPAEAVVATDKSNIIPRLRGQFMPGHRAPGWACMASLDLIVESAKELVHMADTFRFKNVALPHPGCGNGGLKWEDVQPALAEILDDRFHTFTYAPAETLKPNRPKVLNKRDLGALGPDDVYIGRRSYGMHFGNPFPMKSEKDRAKVILQFRAWIKGYDHQDVEPERRQWILNNLETLRGKNLVCFCAPKPCHGDIYMEMLYEEPTARTESVQNSPA